MQIRRKTRTSTRLQREAIAVATSRAPLIHHHMPTRPEAAPSRALSGRKPQTFQQSQRDLEFIMLEGEPHPDGGVYGRWGMRKEE